MHQCLYFGECLKGIVTGSKEFAKRMREMVTDGSYEQALERDNLQGRYRSLYRGEKLERVQEMSWSEDDYDVLTDVMDDEIWARSIVAKGEGETSACLTCEVSRCGLSANRRYP